MKEENKALVDELFGIYMIELDINKELNILRACVKHEIKQCGLPEQEYMEAIDYLERKIDENHTDKKIQEEQNNQK